MGRSKPIIMMSLIASQSRGVRSFTKYIVPNPMQIYYNDVYEVILSEKHRFPMKKYGIVRKRLQQILEPGGLAAFSISPLSSFNDLTTVHDTSYVQRYMEGQTTELENRVVGFPWTPSSMRRALSSVGGTVAAMHAVCRQECLVSGHVAGGTHHALRDRGEGFCVFSDIAVAAAVALRDYPSLIRSVLIVDLDVHQGNGNAAIFKHDDRVFTFSMHCRQNIFSRREDSDLDIELEEGAGDEEYLGLLEKHLPSLLSGVDSKIPDLVFFQAGVDPCKIDRLGRLSLTPEGLRRRNKFVYETVVKKYRRPLVITMGGGYPRDLDPSSIPFQDIVQSHVDVYVDAARACALSNMNY